MANGHENINNEIVANTLEEILSTSRGESMDVLYKALTNIGDERYIHRNIQGFPTSNRRETQGNILREQIAQDPSAFADTVSYKEGKERLAPQQSITSKLLKALGIYKGGGFLGFGKKGKKGKKEEAPERDEALVALDAILSGGYEKKPGKHEYPIGYTVSTGMGEEDGLNLMRIISQISTPEGNRYYPGEGKSRSFSLAQRKAMFDAAGRAYHSPADSITTDQYEKLKELGLFGE